MVLCKLPFLLRLYYENRSQQLLHAKNALVLEAMPSQALPRGVHAIGMKKLSIQSILVPIDFSEMSIQVIQTPAGAVIWNRLHR
jgi:hypothetical protein